LSIHDIANLTNVSIATVSRYINGSGKVAGATAQKIEQAMRETGYRPSIRRPGRKTEKRQGVRTGVITFLSIGRFNAHHMHKEPVFPMLLAGLQGYLIEQGMMVSYAHSQGGDDIPEALESKYCDGVVVYGFESQLGPRLKAKLKTIPTVWCFNREDENAARGFAQVSYDNHVVGELAADYLYQQGHRDVAIFSQMPGYVIFQQREKTFVDRCEALGMQVNCFHAPRENDAFSHYAQIIAQQFVDSKATSSGLFFTSDNFMLAVYNELRVLGRTFDVSDMIGCNNEQQFLAHFHYKPATIDIQVAQMGSRAAQLVLEMLNNPQSQTARRIKLKPQLIESASIAGVSS
jgi:DNA-binding LacI/PurR family transcriptional regulator